MTEAQYDNLKIGDIFYTCDFNGKIVLKYMITSKSRYFALAINKIYVSSDCIDNHELKCCYRINCSEYFLDEKECTIHFIKKLITQKTQLMRTLQKEILDIELEYSDFIKENVEHFI